VIVNRGERVGLLGPNGAGKTTTLLLLLGAITPDAGVITIDGFKLPKQRSKAMTKVGFAAGYLPMPDRLKVREALGVFAGWYGLRRPASCRAACPAGSAHWSASRPPCTSRDSCSRRTDSLARPRIGLKVRTSLMNYCESTGAALLVTSHDMREVEMMTERVMFLARGEVVANDTAAIVASTYGHDNLEDVFLSLAETHRS
jgi:ABC-2 type transport system ATP-binding protein